MWLTALRSHADAATLQQLPPLTDADAARVMARLRHETPGATPPAHPTQPAATPGIATGHFRPRITLMTLGRGDGLLGLRPQGPLGPRGDSVTLAQIDWTYTTHAGESAAPNTIAWHTPAPTSVLNSRPPAIQELFDTGGPVLRMQRNLAAEADAMDRVWDLGLIPVDANKLQWRHRAAAAALGPVWTLAQEAHFGDFWAEQIPKLRAEGWSVVVQPGFA
ncbi:MAG TPA: ATP-dependent helicase, partial [Acidovorax defluvii]|nr:ATP-dependent helicase [Acidovorax defluvii]